MSEMMQYDFTVLEHQLSLIMCVQTFLIFSQVNCSSYFLISHTRAVLGDQSLGIP